MNEEEKPFLSSERSTDSDIKNNLENLSSREGLKGLIDAMPCLVAILDANRQIVFSNKELLALVGLDTLEGALGKRPGEALGCVYAKECKTGCGTSAYCRYCGAAQAIKECQENLVEVEKECHLASDFNNLGALELKVKASPFKVDDVYFTLLAVNDISDTKRRRNLEKTFFHDIINSAGCVKSALSVLNDCDSVEQIKEFIEIASTASLSLIEEVLSQKSLLEAEAGEIHACYESYPLHDIYDQLEKAWIPFAMAYGVKVEFIPNIQYIHTDRVIIRRIIGNLIKNAIEASQAGDLVSVTFSRQSEEELTISVNNPKVISDSVRLQLFQRSFTTKGAGHGIGTYSVKLFTENYLNGKVSVDSVDGKGTTITITLPQPNQDTI